MDCRQVCIPEVQGHPLLHHTCMSHHASYWFLQPTGPDASCPELSTIQRLSDLATTFKPCDVSKNQHDLPDYPPASMQRKCPWQFTSRRISQSKTQAIHTKGNFAVQCIYPFATNSPCMVQAVRQPRLNALVALSYDTDGDCDGRGVEDNPHEVRTQNMRQHLIILIHQP